jgi:parvulin-like peptidyl-prolyl isomerase
VKPLRKLVVLLIALALALPACGGDEDIAGVGDAVIRRSDIEKLFDGAVPSDDVFRDMLFSKVALQVLEQALAAQYGVTADYAAAEQDAQDLEDYLAESGYTIGDYLGVENASHDMLLMHSQVWAVQEAALGKLIVEPETVDDLFADPGTMTEVCVKHILVATAEEAQTVMDRLAAGEDFAAVADEVSLDTNTEGGDLGCASAGSYVDEFAQAALSATIGEVTGPVESEYGFHVLIVSARTPLTREEYLADPWSALSDAQLSDIWAIWMGQVLEEADAWVAADVGTWTPTGIEPPGSETTTTTTATTTTTEG